MTQDTKSIQTKSTKTKCIYALTTHPGHHAKTQAYEGYCFWNNAALAIHELLQEVQPSEIAVLDLDVHAGNGTQEIFYHSSLLTISIHSDPLIEYPHRESFAHEMGENKGKGWNYNLVFQARPSKEEYFRLVHLALEKIIALQPIYLIIPFGADTYIQDPEVNTLAGASLQIEDYFGLGRFIHQSLPNCFILILQEGGYCIEKVGSIVYNFLQGLTKEKSTKTKTI